MASNLTRNGVLLAATNATSAVLGFAVVTALARGLGETAFGRYSLAVAWTLAALPLAEFGLNTALMRAVAARSGDPRARRSGVLRAKALLGFASALAIWVAAPYLLAGQAAETIAALRFGVVLLLGTLAYSTFATHLRARQREAALLALTVAGQLSLLVGVVAILVWDPSVVAIVAWSGVSKTLQALAAWAICRLDDRPGDGGSPAGSDRGGDAPDVATLLREAWPFALTAFVATLQIRLGVLLLGALEADSEIGRYASAARMVDLARFLPAAWLGALLPVLAMRAAEGAPVARLLGRLRATLLGFGVVFAALAWVRGEAMLGRVYGDEYREAGMTLSWLALALVPSLQNALVRVDLFARQQERFALFAALPALAVQTTLGLVLIPRHGGPGAAFALLAGESTTTLLHGLGQRREDARRAADPFD